MKKLAYLILIMLFASMGVLIYTLNRVKNIARVESLKFEAVKSITELTVLRVFVQDIMEAKEEKSGSKMVFIIKGSALYTIDFSKIKFSQKERIVYLPRPQIKHPKIDHNQFEIYSSEKGLFYTSEATDKMRKTYGKPAQARIKQLAANPVYFDKAKMQAEKTLLSIIPGKNWELQWLDE